MIFKQPHGEENLRKLAGSLVNRWRSEKINIPKGVSGRRFFFMTVVQCVDVQCGFVIVKLFLVL